MLSIVTTCAARTNGYTVEELTNAMSQQASITVTARDILDALAGIEGNVIREGQRVRHKHAAQ